ncbi:MAG: baseplate J protein [Halomonas sp.]|nr:baseplate J protein [Halomonas sp.]|tara:strand:- start:3175 stop:4299 length:1125 start_codon:yes stop_codon:yes gene_type:complete
MSDFPRGNLPDISFAAKTVAEVEAEIINGYESIAQRTLASGDPIRLFLESIAAIIVNQRSIIDFAAKQNLLSYAQDIYIDYIGELVGVTRLAAKAAITTLQFRLSQAQSGVYTVAAGTRVNAGELDFTTTEVLEIPAGQLTGDVIAQCTTAGAEGNNLLPGQINTLVTPLPYIQSVTNTTTSSGGADIESDEALVERIRLAPASFSVAGPRDAYVYWALTANQAIIDVGVSSPSPGVVDVRPLLEEGEIPGTDILDQVSEVLSADDVRPLTDQVNVLAPVASNYNIDLEYWISSDDANRITTIQNAVTQAVNDYVLWQKTKIGRDINPDELLSRIKQAGAKRATITAPVFTTLNDTQVAQEGTVTVTYQGTENG